MSETTGGDDNLIWTIIKVALIVIGAIVVLRFVFNLMWALMPVIILLGVAYLVYRVLFGEEKSTPPIETAEPMRLDFDATDDLLEGDPLEEQFKELESRQSHRDN